MEKQIYCWPLWQNSHRWQNTQLQRIDSASSVSIGVCEKWKHFSEKKRSLMNSNQFERQQANSVDNFQSIKIHQWEKLLKQHQTWGHQNHLSQSDFCLRKGCRRTNSQNLKLHFMIGNSKINDNVEKKAETEFLNSHCANTLNVPLYALHCLLTLSVRNRKLSRAERATVANQTVTNSQRKKLKGSKGTGTSKRGKSNHKSHKAKKQRQKKKKIP